jgi:tRNA modification GTPase
MFSAADTIIARCTPSGSGAIALIRLSGPQAFEITDRFAHLFKGSISQAESHTIHYGTIHDTDVIDDVLFFVMKAPRTFTGENTVEITCHNNPFIIQSIINLACQHGARPARPGEFTQQAVLNKKMDALQAEAIHDLITAPSEQALKVSRQQLNGSLSAEILKIENDLLHALALSEASFEFIEDEDIEFGNQIKDFFHKTEQAISSLEKQYPSQKIIKEGIRIALIGSVNAGKSSLFNKLVGHDRAIVTPIAGTTRDIIECLKPFDGTFITYVDTAGLRTTADVIEQNGIERSYTEAKNADIILLVIDSSRIMNSEEKTFYKKLFFLYKEKIIVVNSKQDLSLNLSDSLEHYHRVHVSHTHDETILLLQEKIIALIKEQVKSFNSPFLLNKRHLELLQSIKVKIAKTQEMMNHGYDYELIAYNIKDILADLKEVSGKTISEQSMDKIFKEFCIGK